MKVTHKIAKTPLAKPYFVGDEIENILQVLKNDKHDLAEGAFAEKCEILLKNGVGSKKIFLTNSCTAALEMAGILADIQPGDEVIMPSFTFPSTANAFVLRGAIPIFIDIREDTLNIDEKLIVPAITAKTKAIVPVHYAGVACEMKTINAIANQHGLIVIEDAAQAISAKYHSQALGSCGHLAAFSFHFTKNITSGLGGCLLLNDESFLAQAEIIYHKGTNRSAYLRQEIDRYNWVDVGSSFMSSELTNALLFTQLQKLTKITEARLSIWNRYHHAFQQSELNQMVKRPSIPAGCQHNGHIYYLLLPNKYYRDQFIKELNSQNIGATFHFVPLHNSPGGIKYGKTASDMQFTESLSERLVRLPIWPGLEPYLDDMIATMLESLNKVLH